MLAEKSDHPLDLARWTNYGGAYMSVVTASELLVGVERANTPERKAQRAAFVEHLLSLIPILDFSLPVGRTHARMLAGLPKNLTAGAYDALIAATAIHYGHTLLTRNVSDFTIFAGLKVEAFRI
ncbi:PIN domain-containing protein [Rhodoferax sp.]|uniref:PIN domain-containing protein n=1 Tax=Rhodoferax sp. TaxID=50421 RepID=UPI0026021066|nr:PIN domain-containing protein [Rhodoferax sp.]